MDNQKIEDIGTQLNIPPSKIFTIGQISNYLHKKLDDDDFLSDIYILGEISNLSKYNHTYFNLKDDDSLISAIFFGEYANRLEFELKDGMEVLVYGKVQLYKKNSKNQIKVHKVFPIGEGIHALRLKELKQKLMKEGLFEETHKKPIPKLPRVIGIATSTKGKAVSDMVTAIKERNCNVKIKVIPTIVQGEKASKSIIRSIQFLNKQQSVDVIIVGRGGGSTEDIDCFNDEDLAREIFNSKKPIITAIGHQHDTSIADHVSDLKAITPTDTARKVIADKEELLSKIEYLEDSLMKAYQSRKIIKKQKKEITQQKKSIIKHKKDKEHALSLIDPLKKDIAKQDKSLRIYKITIWIILLILITWGIIKFIT